MLIATVVARGETTVVANARYVAEKGDASPRTAEVAFIVEEDYQGLGIAGRLLEHLAAIARANGIDRFTADVLPGNNSMLAVFARSGLPMTQKPGDGVVHVTMALTAPRP
jgi:GNAT superfamily N-acetyltransferase